MEKYETKTTESAENDEHIETDEHNAVTIDDTTCETTKWYKTKIYINVVLLIILLCLLLILPTVVGLLVKYVGIEKSDFVALVEETLPLKVVEEEGPWQELLLSGNIVPKSYILRIYPNFYDDNAYFYGNTTIHADVKNDTKYVILNIQLFNVTSTKIYEVTRGKRQIAITRAFPYRRSRSHVIETAGLIQTGTPIIIDLQYEGKLSKQYGGLYKSSYHDHEANITRYLVTSKFEPLMARKAFPCFDEPNFKANFTVTLIHKPEFVALSNMPINYTKPWSDGLIATTFQESVPMSTYLVCFTICEFVQINTTTSKGTLIRVWADPAKAHQLNYSLHMANYTLQYFETLFEIDYPLPKLDMIALPDFFSGAMEHWGLVSFRETSMLFDPQNSSPFDHERVAYIIAHELAHMWFGNLVTMEWFSHIWLNEGLASYFHYWAVNEYHKDWNWSIANSVLKIEVNDGGLASPPIIKKLVKRSDVWRHFGLIVYQKGASMMYMIERVIGRETLLKGLRSYLRKHAYGNVVTADLWVSLSKAMDCDGCMATFMDEWTTKSGYPYVNISYVINSDGTTTFTATQARFLYNQEHNDSTIWQIPLDYITSDDKTVKLVWLNVTSNNFVVNIDMNDRSSWIKFNINQRGMYRVNYGVKLWTRFGWILNNTDIETSGLSSEDRGGLIADVTNLANAGMLTSQIALDVIKYLHKEKDYFVWSQSYESIFLTSDMLRISPEYGLWKKYVQSLTEPMLKWVGWGDTGGHTRKQLRARLISLACYHGSRYCLNNARKIFVKWIYNDTRVSAGIRSEVYKYGVSHGGTEEEWDIMWSKYRTEIVSQEKSHIIKGLTRTRDIFLVHKLLYLIQNSPDIKQQDIFHIIEYLSYNNQVRETVWVWLKRNWKKFVKKYKLNRHLLRALSSLVSVYNTQEQLDEVAEFGEKHKEISSIVKHDLVPKIKTNMEWMRRNRDVIVKWLHEHVN